MDDFLAKNQVLLQIIGSIMLFFFGIYTFRSNPVQSIRPVSSTPGSYLHNFVTAFFVTLSNPLIIFLFIGLFARFSFVMPGSPIGFHWWGIWLLYWGRFSGGSELRILSIKYAPVLIYAAFGF